jgi:TM2 domain-containing membrane protein YozV
MKAGAIILNFFFPGVGSLIIGSVGQGIAQLVLYLLGIIFTFTLIGAILGIPMMLGAWIWGLVTAATYNEVPPVPQQIHIIHNNAPPPQPTESNTPS